MEIVVVKKQKIKQRHKRVALEFHMWLLANPKATMEQQQAQFNAIADTEFYRENREAS